MGIQFNGIIQNMFSVQGFVAQVVINRMNLTMGVNLMFPIMFTFVLESAIAVGSTTSCRVLGGGWVDHCVDHPYRPKGLSRRCSHTLC